MIQTDKDLLLKDLCARLPYGVKCHIGDNKPYTLSSVSDDYDGTIVGFKEQKNGFNMEVYLSECKLYLFPMSSMTEEQKEEIEDKLIFPNNSDGGWVEILYNDKYDIPFWFIDFCNKNHLDYMGLIDKGLSIDATNLSIY